MADNTSTVPSSGHGRGGGRRRGRGGAPPSGRSDEPRKTGDGAGRGGKSHGRGGRGSGGRDKQQIRDSAEASETQSTPTVAPLATKEVAASTDDADDGEICFICASTVEHTSVSPCNHRTCHICALRLRALYKNKGCAHCRVCLLLALSTVVGHQLGRLY